MANRIKIKRSTTKGAKPATDIKAVGELYINMADKTIGYTNTAGIAIEHATFTQDLDVKGITVGCANSINNAVLGPGAMANAKGTRGYSVAVGKDALSNDTVGGNTAVGNAALMSNTTGAGNTAVGESAMVECKAGSENTATGQASLTKLTSGNRNVGFGAIALSNLVTGSCNSAVGYNSLGNIIASSNNIAIGDGCIKTLVSGDDNTAVGFRALSISTGAARCVAIGANAMGQSPSGTNNVAVGHRSLEMVAGANNVGIGVMALCNLTSGGGVAVGANALEKATTGFNNVGIGDGAGKAISTGSSNLCIGPSALGGATPHSGSGNTLVGSSIMSQSTAGDDNVIVGHGAYIKGNASGNVAVGTNCLSLTTTGMGVAVGYHALMNLTTGTSNVAVGRTAMTSLATGGRNVAIGTNACSAGIAVTGNVALGSNALLTGTFDNVIGLGADTLVTGNNQCQLGSAGVTAYSNGAVSNRSDKRDKADIRPTTLGLAFINALTPVDYKWDMRDDYLPKPPDDCDDIGAWAKSAPSVHDMIPDGTHKRKRYHHGFIAQDIQSINTEFGGLQDHSVNGGMDVLTLGYTELIAPLVKAIQELSDDFEAYKRSHP